MKKYLLIAIISIIVTASTTQAQTPAFNGKWTFNQDQSDLGEIPAYAGNTKLEVNLDNQTLSIVYHGQDSKGNPNKVPVHLTWNGKPSEVITYTGKKWVSNIEKHSDESLLITIHTFTTDGKAFMNIIETWQLSDDGSMLSIHREVTQLADGLKYSIKLAFDKQ
jgi:hypothetical protein